MNKNSLNILFLIVFIDMLGFGVIIPFLPYLVGKLGASGLFATSLLSIYSLMQFIFSPLLGRLSDKYGRKPILLFCLSGSAISYLIYGSAFFITQNSHLILWLIFSSRLFAGVMGASIPVAYAYIADKTSSDQRTEAMGKIGAAFGLGFIFGPAIASFLTPLGPSAPGFCAMLICLVGFSLALKFLKESKNRHSYQEHPHFTLENICNILTQKNIGLLILITLLYGFAFVQMESIFSLFAATIYHLKQAQIGWIFVYLGVLIAISQGALVGKLSLRFGDTNLLLFGALLLVFSFFFISYTKNVWVMIILMGGVALGAGAINPTLSAILSHQTTSDKQGITQGISQSASSLSRILGPIIAGISFDTWSPAAPFFLGTILMLLTTGIIIIFRLCLYPHLKKKSLVATL
ncbi:MAG: multidrug resistance protein [Gammaproteobacteria bacterium]|jgi:DHA1 family tetracycline resistance protein-like MFS transporter|nr:multidrug resistance protein [Gammaproteobacteria bacterium]